MTLAPDRWARLNELFLAATDVPTAERAAWLDAECAGDPDLRAKAIVEATTHYRDPEILARVSAGLGEPMVGISASTLRPEELLETRGW